MTQSKSTFNEKMTRNATWAAVLLIAAALAFFGFAINAVNFRDLEDYILVGFPLVLAGASLASIFIMRRGKLTLGSGIIFSLNLVVPLLLAIIVRDTLWTASAYALVSSALLIWRSMPRHSWRWAIIAASATLIVVVVINLINPSGRFSAPAGFDVFVTIVLAILFIAFIAQAVRQAWDSNIRVKLISSLIVLSVVSVATVATVVTITVRSSTQRQIENTFQELSQNQLTSINNYFLEKVGALNSLALSDVIDKQVGARNKSYYGSDAQILSGIQALDAKWVAAPDYDPLILNTISRDENVNPTAYLLQRFTKEFNDNVEVFVTDRYGATIAATDRLSDYYQADEGWWQAAWNEGNGALYISNPEFDESAGVSALLVALPIRDKQTGEPIGVLRSTILIDSLYNVLNQIHPGETGYAMLFDREGNVLMNPRAEELGNSDLSTETINHIITESITQVQSDVSSIQTAGHNTDIITNITGDQIFAGYKPLLPLQVSGRVFFDDIGSGAGIERLCVNGDADIAQASRAIKDSEIASCKSIGRDPIGFPVGVDAVAVITSAQNNFLTNVTKNELAQIFSTAVNWSDVRSEWPNKPILRNVPASIHGTYSFFVESVFNNSEEPLQSASNLTISDDFGLLIQDVLRSSYSIGFVTYGRYQENANALKVLSIDGVAAELEAVENFEYPLARPLYLYSDAKIMQEKPQVAVFINYFLTHANEDVEAAGYFPLNQQTLNNSKTEWLNAVGQTFGAPGESNGEIVLPDVNPIDYPGDVVSSGSSTVYRLEDLIVERYQDELTGRVYLSDQAETTLDTVNKLGWTVMVRQDSSEALAAVDAVTRNSILVSLLVVLAATFVALVLAQTFVRPISQLTNDALQLAEGKLFVRSQVKSNDEIGVLASTFNSMTSQLQETLQGLEERVAARTKDLATVAEVGTATATILESKRLLQEVVDLTKERFNLYHSHIYLLDEEGKNLVLTAGAGEPGRIMVAEGRSIPLDLEQSLVARAARERKGVTVNDVTQAPDHLPNPLLPDTRSELAVPMIVGGNVIGVFDIQSEQVGRFTDSDVNIQTTMAAQLATSIQNVRSFERSKKDAELQSLVNMIGSRIQRTTSIEETLQTAIRELGTAIGASRVKAKIGHSNGNN